MPLNFLIRTKNFDQVQKLLNRADGKGIGFSFTFYYFENFLNQKHHYCKSFLAVFMCLSDLTTKKDQNQ